VHAFSVRLLLATHPLHLKQRGVKGVGRIEGSARHDVREEGAIATRHPRRDGTHRRSQEEQERERRAEADRAGEQRQGAGGDDERLLHAPAHLATIQESPAPGRGDSLAQGVDADEQRAGRERAARRPRTSSAPAANEPVAYWLFVPNAPKR